jgi:integrase/recombinase XerD
MQSTPFISYPPSPSQALAQLQQMVQYQRQYICQQSEQINNLNLQNQSLISQLQAMQAQLKAATQEDSKFDKYKDLKLRDLANEFIASFQIKKTKATYTEGFDNLFAQKFLDPQQRLEDFKKMNGEHILDQIRLNFKGKAAQEVSQATKQLRAAMFISFTAFLQRRTESYIVKTVPNKFGFNKTYGFRRDRTKASPLSAEEINSFLTTLKTFSQRAYLFASLQLLGVKRVSEVINLKVEDLDLKGKLVLFQQLKTRGLVKDPIVIYLPPKLCEELEIFLNGRKEGFVFTNQSLPNQTDSASAAPMTRSQISKLYMRAWRKVFEEKGSTLKAPKMITHSLRAAGISYLYEKGVDTQLIKEISGHAKGDMVMYYNLKSKYDNISKKIHIFDSSLFA